MTRLAGLAFEIALLPISVPVWAGCVVVLKVLEREMSCESEPR